jgi:hypothetical protein
VEQLLPLLSQFGPYGVIATVVIGFVWKYLLARNPDLIKIPAPNAPAPDTERFPILSKLLKLFGASKVADLTPEAIDALRVELEDLAAMQHGDLSAKLAAASELLKKLLANSLPVKLQ